MRTLASIYLASLSNVYRHAYLARSVIQPVEEEGRKTKWKNSLPHQVPFSGYMHAGHADCTCIRVNIWPASPSPLACTMLQYSPTGDDILMIFIGHRYYRMYRYYCPALVDNISLVDQLIKWLSP